ncbi:glycosyl hydrolase 115 family protein [Paenibacillus tengchongensis]|uniref:glycosyl hydrolase 115 family protein n=1 Tax=Paenibacillus tengchongensis TaxID=2608684 RepID=UPI00124D240D|nr:glycosyl hydrolase 115 family protein [Paenibacillus tengchongensis]
MEQVTQTSRQLELISQNRRVCIYVSDTETSAVQHAVRNLVLDIGRTCGAQTELSTEMNECSIVIGTLDQKVFADQVQELGLALELLAGEDGSYRWEGYLQQASQDVLYIIGTDRRGTIFGIYDLCEALGVSPWHYWADVPAKVKESFRIPADYRKADWPSVKYRGIFLNDEEELDAWSKLHTPDGTIGPEAYRHIFELLLRLKANYIWPAMHVNYFNGNPRNGELAEEMGVVVGTSHCDMLLRSNQNEWEPWLQSKGYEGAVYDYSIAGQNRDILKEYWRESVELNRNYEVSFTMGMRGIHDSGFHTRAIDEDASLTEEQKQQARVALLAQVISDQRQILQEVLGPQEAESLQTFVPYKEVLDLYDQELDVPDNVTLIWANDNFGHVRRYPDENERRRSGGNGLYFHNSYWAAPGTAMSYLFINSIPLAHTGNELRKAYESGIRNIWILNVGGLKPLEQDMEFFLQYGWDADKDEALVKNTLLYTEDWINRNFTGRHGREAAEIYEAFAQLTNVRKIEHMNSNVFSQTAYGDEAGRRLQRLEDVYRRANGMMHSLPAGEREAFFQLFLMKIHASYYINHEYYYADRSVLSYKRGNLQAADRYVELSLKMVDYKRRMLHYYNKKMSGGKWDAMLTPEAFPPPPAAMHPVRQPALRISGGGMRVDLWNEGYSLSFSPYGQRQKWIDLGNQGTGSFDYFIEIQAGAGWMTVSEPKGTVQTEKRILVSVLEPEQHAGEKGLLIIRNLTGGTEQPVEVRMEADGPLPERYTGYVEADGAVSIPAAGFDRTVRPEGSPSEESGWITVPGIGRYEGAAVMAWSAKLTPLEGELKQNPYLEYDFYVMDSRSFLLEIHRFLTLNSTGRIRFGIGIDGLEPVLIETATNDEWRGQWQDAVFNNGEKLTVELPCMDQGAHRLQLYMVDPYVTISKLVIYTKQQRVSNLGPVYSSRSGKPVAEYGLECPEVRWSELEELCSGLYRTAAEELAPLPAVYATEELYTSRNEVFIPAVSIPQSAPAGKRYVTCLDDDSKDVIGEFGSGVFAEQNGVVAIEAEYALEQSVNAYLTESKDGSKLVWSHLQAETNGRTGLAMHVAEPGKLWDDPAAAPAMHYRIHVGSAGRYRVWMLIRHYNNQSDSCSLALDGKVLPLTEQFNQGKLYTYNTSYVYFWSCFCSLEITEGEHVLSVIARKSELRVDRIYLTQGYELPPVDCEWKDSARV